MTSTRYRVYARDVQRRRLGEIDDFHELKVEIRFNDVGGWYMRGAASSKVASLLSETGGIIVTRNFLDGTGPHVVFSGPVTSYLPNAVAVEVAGVSDEQILADRAASPDPTTDEPPYSTEQDLRDGTASTVMREYVEVNCIVGVAPTSLGVPGLTLAADPGLGSTVYGSPRWDLLLELLQALAIAGGGLRFQVLQSDVSVAQVEFSVSQPADRTATAVISKGRGNLGEWQRSRTRPTATRVLALGQGQGINRQVRQGTDGAAASKYGYQIDLILDRRDTNDVLVLDQAVSVALEEGAETNVVTYTPIDTPSFRWGQDYDLGDLVTVITGDGETLQEVVRGVDLALAAPASGAAPIVRPIVSTPGDTADDPASRQQRAVSRRVSRIERSVDSLAAAVAVQWNIGDLRQTLRAAAAPGWLLCQGQAVSRVTYSGLFGVIGTTYGSGDGSTTFNVPDFQDRFPIGKSGTRALGSTGGAETANLQHSHTGAPHTHSHTHTGPSHQHTGAPHTHAHQHTGPDHFHSGAPHTHSHTHTGPSHQHTGAAHTHNHSHDATGLTFTGTGGTTGTASAETSNLRTVTPEEADASTKDHTHSFTPAGTLGGSTASTSTAASFSSDTGAAGTGATGSDGTAASFSGNTGNSGTGATGADSAAAAYSADSGAAGTGATGSDSTAASYSAESGTALSTTQSIVPPYLAVNVEIYTGV